VPNAKSRARRLKRRQANLGFQYLPAVARPIFDECQTTFLVTNSFGNRRFYAYLRNILLAVDKAFSQNDERRF